MSAGGRRPVILLTGFLGSGKTTLLSRVLHTHDMANALVVINEFGAVGLDHHLLDASSDDTILLANGCLCCTIRGNLVDTLGDADRHAASGRLPPFDRVVVETSGLADPDLLLGFVLGVEDFRARYRIEAVVTVVDPFDCAETLRRHPEAVAQVQAADRLIVSKTDIAPPEAIAAARGAIAALNPAAPIVLSSPETATADTLVWNGAETPSSRHEPPEGSAEHDAHAHPSPDAASAHRDILARSYVFRAPVPEARAVSLASRLAAALDDDILRIKALLPDPRTGDAAVIHGVGRRLDPVTRLSDVAVGDGRLVIIGRGTGLERFDAMIAEAGGEVVTVA